jgi:hypothetical protein
MLRRIAMEEKDQEIKEVTSGIVVLDSGVSPTDEDIRGVCCAAPLIPYRNW